MLTPTSVDAINCLPQPTDALGRPLRELRISVTDRCNFRCTYCMPRNVFGNDHPFLPGTDLLSFDEITRLARHFVALGVEKIRITGGEPLLRKHLESLIASLADLRTAKGTSVDLCLTTNGSALRTHAQALRNAGLKRITVSLDALDPRIFQRMTDSSFTPADVLSGLDAAQQAGFESIKVNMVVRRGLNEVEILPMARHFRHSGVALRFIEYMDVGNANRWDRSQVVPSVEVLKLLRKSFDLAPLDRSISSETAQRWRYQDGGGEIGLISSVTQAFCRDCNRARLSPEGRLYLCLFAHRGHDLRSLLRGGASDDQLDQTLIDIWSGRQDRYSETRAPSATTPLRFTPKIEMHYIGG